MELNDRQNNIGYIPEGFTRTLWLGHDVTTEIIPDLNFTHQFDLPFQSDPDDFERNILGTISRLTPTEKHINIQAATGRGGFLDPFVFKWHGIHPSTFTNVYLKGIGITDEQSAAYMVDSTHQTEVKWLKSVPPVFDKGIHEVIGATILSDAQLDAQRSLEMHQAGVRVRLPIASFKVNTVVLDGKPYSVEDLIAQGWQFNISVDKVPVISVWARRYPYSFRDLKENFSRALGDEEKRQTANATLQSIFKFIQFDDDSRGKLLGLKYKHIKDFSLDNQAELDLFLWMARRYGKEMRNFKSKGIYHGMLTDHNTSPGVEFSDNSMARILGKGFGGNHELATSKNEIDEIKYHIEQLQVNVDRALKRSNSLIESNTQAIIQAFNLAYRLPI